MKWSSIGLGFATLLAIPFFLIAQTSFPRMTTVDPAIAKVGAVVSAAGENLDKSSVSDVFLTDGKSDTRVQITEQAASAIKFRVPDSVKPGRFSIVIRTSTTPPKEYIQPVKVTIE